MGYSTQQRRDGLRRITPAARDAIVAYLEFQTGPRKGERLRIAGGRLVIGRHPGCDIIIDHSAVSRQHAAVTAVGEACFVEDLGSRNGTLVNGERIAEPSPLVAGDEIEICEHRLIYRCADDSRLATMAVTGAAGTDVLDEDAGNSVILTQQDVSGVADGDLAVQAEAKLRAFVGLARAIGASLSLEEVLPRLLEGVLAIFPRADRGCVLLAEPQSRRMILRAKQYRGVAPAGPLRLSMALVNRVVEERRAVLSADAIADSRFSLQHSLPECQIRSVLCAPVIGRDDVVLGVVQVDSRDVHDGFTGADLDLLVGVAGRAAQAIELALAHDERVGREQLNRDLELAQRVQQGLLPSRPPDFPGYEVFDHYEAARQVGGDFFGYVPLSDGRLAVVLADVSGKGMSAALLMAALSADVRYCLASERDVAVAVARIDDGFRRAGWEDRFATLAVVQLEATGNRATICNAGHLPVYLRTADGEVRPVGDDLGGLPLGFGDGGPYRSHVMELAPGDAFVLFTDGITEALDEADRLYGFERLERVMRGPAASAEELGRRIVADVERHSAGQVRSDDICLVCVRRQD